MKYVVIFFLLLGGGIAYVRMEQPTVWNSLVKLVRAPDDQAGKASPDNTPAPDSPPARDNPPAPVQPAAVIPHGPEYITPDTAHINVDHTHDVEQPVQPGANTKPAYVPPDPLPQQPDWTWTVNGKNYLNVVPTRVDADVAVVHISYDGGVASLHIADLPPYLKKQFNYDPDEAAAVAKAKADAAAIQAGQTPSTNSPAGP